MNVKAFIDYPDGFNATSADPTADKSDHTWLFDEIAPGASEKVKIKGEVTADGGTTLTMITQVGIQEPDGFFNIQAEASDDILIVNPELQLTIEAPQFASAGDVLPLTLSIENSSEVDIEQIQLQLQFSGKAVDTSEVELDTIEILEAGESIDIEYITTVKDVLPNDVSKITSTFSVASAEVGGSSIEFDTSVEAETQLQGNVSLESEARYYDDDLTKLGDGPLPPKVGSTTTYVIRWTVASSGGNMEDLQVQTTLLDNVTYEGSSDDRVSYSSSNNTVALNLRSVKDGDSKFADFEVSVTPTKEDKGKLLVLLSESILTAVDTSSEETVQAQTGQVTSNLTNDPGTTDDGVVVKKNAN